MRKRLSIYVSSPDSYSDVFTIFLKGFRKYWSDCPYEFILTTNSYSYEGLTCICNHLKEDTWVERTIAALPRIESKYILLMCDDLIINDKVNNSKIEKILDYMDLNNIKYCHITPLNFGNKILYNPLLRKINKQTPYAVNLQIGIFRKDYFIDILGEGNLSAWQIENEINKLAVHSLDENYDDIIGVGEIVIPYIHGVVKGKWFRKAIKYIRNNYSDEVICRSINSYKEELFIYLKSFILKNINPKIRLKIKSLLKKIGISFAIDY